MNDVKTPGAARPTEAERAMEEGERAMRATLTQLSRAADMLDGDWQQFRQAC